MRWLAELAEVGRASDRTVGARAFLVGLRAALLLFLLTTPLVPVGADDPGLELLVSVEPTTVQVGQTLDYSITLRNSNAGAMSDATVRHVLAEGFTYVAGSTEISYNHTPISASDPVVSGGSLSWPGLDVPAGRGTSLAGMHTFVQDRCSKSYIEYQLDRVSELMEPNAFAKQLFYGITKETTGPLACWADFVNACYDRGLLPVVRLQGRYGGPNWIKPQATAPGDYSEIAQAYARVVNGLPKREGRPLYVEIWNEPNLDIEWSGQANPTEYAHFLVDVAQAIRALGDGRVRILNGGLSPGGNYESRAFIDAMASVPGALQAFDVWSVHPYPGNHPPEYNIHDGTATIYKELTIDSYLLELERLAAHGRVGVQVLLTETGYALGQSNFVFQGYPPIGEANRADYILRALRDHWSRWPEVLGVCPFELVDPFGTWWVWDWLYPSGARHQQYDAVASLDMTPGLAKGELAVRFRVRASDQPGTYGGRVEVISSSGDLIAHVDVPPVQVGGLPPTPTPSVTASPIATPTHSPTPSVTPVCYPVLENVSFEDDGAWELPNTVHPASYTETLAHQGMRSMLVGVVGEANFASYSSARQAFQVPASCSSVQIAFWYYPVSEDTAHGRQYVLLLDADKQYLETVMWIASDARQWDLWQHEVVGHQGETLWIHFGVYNDGQGPASAMYVDDVDVQLCGPDGILAPTAMPSYGRLWLPLLWKEALSGVSAQEESRPRETPTSPVGVSAIDLALPARPAGLTALALPSEEGEAGQIRAMALDERRRRLLLAVEDELMVLDAVSGRTIFSRPLASSAMALAVDGDSGTIYAVLPDRGELRVFASDGAERRRIDGLGRPTNLVVGLGRVYVADSAGHRVVAIDSENHSIIVERSLPAPPLALALDPRTRRLYVGQMGTGMILALDADTLGLEDQVALEGLGYPRDLALDATTGRLYVAHALSPKYGAISAIDPADMSVVATVWGDRDRPLSEADAVSVDGSRGVALLGYADGLVALDAASLEVLDTARIARGGWAGVLAIDRLEGTAYVAEDKGRLWTWRPVVSDDEVWP